MSTETPESDRGSLVGLSRRAARWLSALLIAVFVPWLALRVCAPIRVYAGSFGWLFRIERTDDSASVPHLLGCTPT